LHKRHTEQELTSGVETQITSFWRFLRICRAFFATEHNARSTAFASIEYETAKLVASHHWLDVRLVLDKGIFPMSLLDQEQKDDAARGEELTKGTSHVFIAGVIAAVIVTAAIAIYVITGQKPPVATGEVLGVWAHPMHTQTPGYDASGAQMAVESFDQVMVFVQVRLHNQSQSLLSLLNTAANATLDDGIHTCYAATPSGYDSVFLAYPGLNVPHGKALPLVADIQPGQSLEGTFVAAFKMSKQEWDARKDLNFSFSFRYQPNLVLKPKVPVIEQ
jgi:hypothetical protein